LAENPLLPHRKLRELHKLMLRGRELERKRGHRSREAREGLLAAAIMQLLPGDALCAQAGDATALALLPRAVLRPTKSTSGTDTSTARKSAGAVEAVAPAVSARLTASAGVALGMQSAGTGGLVLTLLQGGSIEPGWAEALAWAQERQLPLIVACSDAMGSRAAKPRKQKSQSAMTWSAVEKLAKRLRLPVLAVDGEDAVAVYRVMQEAVIRARSGAGPALIWAVMTSANMTGSRPSRSAQPVARMESYLAARKIALPGTRPAR
jgi:pyruvate dehydrogenase E1 component alpha subunit